MACTSCLKKSICEVQLANVMQQQDLHICNAMTTETHELCCTGKQAFMTTRDRVKFCRDSAKQDTQAQKNAAPPVVAWFVGLVCSCKTER